MTKPILVALLSLFALAGCGDAFTAAEFSQSGVAGAVPSAGSGSAEASQAGSLSAAGAAGASGAAAAGAPATAGAAGSSAGAPSSAGAGAGAGGASPLKPPCEHAVDTVSPGYLALERDTCYRTTEVFDTITCVGSDWDKRTIKVNGQLAVCNRTQALLPPYEGYNYFEITGAPPGTDVLRWSLSTGG